MIIKGHQRNPDPAIRAHLLRRRGISVWPVKSVHKMAKIVRGQDCEFLLGSQEERNAGIVYGTTTDRYQGPFLHPSLPEKSGVAIGAASVFGSGYDRLGRSGRAEGACSPPLHSPLARPQILNGNRSLIFMIYSGAL